MFLVRETFFILKCACLGVSKYLNLHWNCVSQQSATRKIIIFFLPNRLNYSGLSDDTKTSKFSFYTFSRYSIEKLIWSLVRTTYIENVDQKMNFLWLTKLRSDFLFTDLSQHFGIYLVVFALKLFIHRHDGLTHSFPMHAFSTPWKQRALWFFRGIEKGCIGN